MEYANVTWIIIFLWTIAWNIYGRYNDINQLRNLLDHSLLGSVEDSKIIDDNPPLASAILTSTNWVL